MPTIALSEFKAPRDNVSTHKIQFVRYTGPASYATGGDAFAPSDAGFGNIDAIVPAGVAYDGTNVRLLAWDKTNGKLVWIVPDTNAEVANATDLSAFDVVLLVYGQ